MKDNDFKLPTPLKFLASTRFWVMVLGILASYISKEVTGIEAIQLLLTGFVGIRTVDRFAEKTGSKDTTGSKTE